MRGVEQHGPCVSYTGGPWFGLWWDPFILAPSGEIRVTPSPNGFDLRFRLGIWRILIVAAWAFVFSSKVMGMPFGTLSLGVSLLTGVCWAFVAWLDLVALPGKIRRLITPPSRSLSSSAL